MSGIVGPCETNEQPGAYEQPQIDLTMATKQRELDPRPLAHLADLQVLLNEIQSMNTMIMALPMKLTDLHNLARVGESQVIHSSLSELPKLVGFYTLHV